VNPNFKEINAKDQIGDEKSVFSFYQKLICLRKSEEYKQAIVYGNLKVVWKNIRIYLRFTELVNIKSWLFLQTIKTSHNCYL